MKKLLYWLKGLKKEWREEVPKESRWIIYAAGIILGILIFISIILHWIEECLNPFSSPDHRKFYENEGEATRDLFLHIDESSVYHI